jgi:hypothetical protein
MTTYPQGIPLLGEHLVAALSPFEKSTRAMRGEARQGERKCLKTLRLHAERGLGVRALVVDFDGESQILNHPPYFGRRSAWGGEIAVHEH